MIRRRLLLPAAAIALLAVVCAAALPHLAGASRSTEPATATPEQQVPAARPSALRIVRDGVPVEWWQSERAPIRWHRPLPLVADAFAWRALAPGLEMAEAELHVTPGMLRLRIVAVRLDPAHFDLALEHAARANGVTGNWTVDDAPADAVFAVNAGQFSETGPWGWLVRDGREERLPGRGPLVAAITIDSAGRVGWVPSRLTESARSARRPLHAFQSYPVVIDDDGTVPPSLRPGRREIDLAHRDIRLGLGLLDDGRLLFVLTRFAYGGRAGERLPFGLTVPESAALLGAMGARHALMLDGGLSAQMLVRPRAEDGATQPALAWRGGRRVPLAMIARPRAELRH
jgi:hypothetical protein